MLNELIERAGGSPLDAPDSSAAEAGGLTPAAAGAAAFWFREFLDSWVPRLLLGRDDESRARLGRAAPGGFRRRRCSDDPRADGIDAEEFTELIFQEAPLVRDRDAEDWFDPAALLTRLKDLRAEVAAAELAELVSWSGV